MPSFEELKVNKSFLKALTESGITEPTEIQAMAIPVVRSGADVIGVAQTGTGKTLAYLLPLLMKLKCAQGDMPRAIILVPTRELVLQVKDTIDFVTLYSDLRSVALYGGVGISKQVDEIKALKGVDLLISTPGRLKDVYSTGVVNYKMVKTMVFDEADRILDMGFVPQIRALLEIIQTKRQNLLFSATFSEKLKGMAAEFLTFPERVEVSPSATPAVMVDQFLYAVPNLRTKLHFLEHLFDNPEFEKVLVFCRTKENADSVTNYLDRKSVLGEIRTIHSNKGQTSRINAINSFKRGDTRILISTDVSARGIDVSKVTHVINFDVPVVYEDYVHRIGRTGRIFNRGVAITFVTPPDVFHIQKISTMINQPLEVEPIPPEVRFGEYIPYEKKDMEREVDAQKKLDDPEFQGAFHVRKKNSEKKKPQPKKARPNTSNRR